MPGVAQSVGYGYPSRATQHKERRMWLSSASNATGPGCGGPTTPYPLIPQILLYIPTRSAGYDYPARAARHAAKFLDAAGGPCYTLFNHNITGELG